MHSTTENVPPNLRILPETEEKISFAYTSSAWQTQCKALPI